MTKVTPREEGIERALSNAKAARRWLVANDARPEEIDESEIDAFEWAMDRASANGRLIWESALVMAGIVFSIMTAVLAIILTQRHEGGVDPGLDGTFLFFGGLAVVPIIMIWIGGVMDTRAAAVRRGLTMLRIRRARRIRQLSQTRGGRKRLRSRRLI